MNKLNAKIAHGYLLAQPSLDRSVEQKSTYKEKEDLSICYVQRLGGVNANETEKLHDQGGKSYLGRK